MVKAESTQTCKELSLLKILEFANGIKAELEAKRQIRVRIKPNIFDR